MKDKLKLLPSVDAVTAHPDVEPLLEKMPRQDVVDALRESLSIERKKILSGIDPGSRQDITRRSVQTAVALAAKKAQLSLRRVINATGIIVHTNLGRAILADEAVEAIKTSARYYTNLEYDLERNTRGKRLVHLKKYLTELTSAEDALVVNNNAAALLLILDTFASGKEVVVSRGELIEIGGSFRLPEILKTGGAILREVGCTNKTYLSDYEEAINENTAALLKTHKSNYTIRGFSSEVEGSQVAKLAQKYDIISIEDLGSGLLIDLSQYGLHGEPTVSRIVESGIDLVTFSGDKLLGGPQAGIIVGKKELIRKMEKNHLTRALRVGKLTISAMESTLAIYRDPEKLKTKLPILRMLSLNVEQLTGRIRAVIEKSGVEEKGALSIISGSSKIGGGAFPDADIPTALLAVDPPEKKPGQVNREFLKSDPPVIGRIHQGKFLLDLRTVLPEEDEMVAEAIKRISKT